MASYLPPPSLAEFAWPVQFCAFVTAATWVASLITSNVSQVDRLWTFLPTIYTAYFALLPLWPRNEQPFILCPYVPTELSFSADNYSPRGLVMLGLIVIWMFRLSYNTYRRGLFSLQDEDYRWAVLRTQVPPWFFQVVNLTFIAAIQNALLMLLGIPTYVAVVSQPHTALSLSDLVLGAATLLTLVLEFTADNQQYAFQSYKQSYLIGDQYDEQAQWPGARLNWIPADAKRGFVTRGLWAWSRHPNFTCEQTFWWLNALFPVMAPYPPVLPHYSMTQVSQILKSAVAYLFSSAVYDTSFSDISSMTSTVLIPFWPIASAVALSILFFSSTLYTESITLSKYPTYAVYQGRVAMFGFSKTLMMSLWHRLGNAEKSFEVDQILWGSGKGKGKEE